MEEMQIIEVRWTTIIPQVIEQTVQTPQGPMKVQQQVGVPAFFRNMEEVSKFLNEHKDEQQTTLYRVAMYADSEVNWYYKGE